MNKEPQQMPTPPLVEIAPLVASRPAPEGESLVLRQRWTLPEIIRKSMHMYFLPITTVVRFALKLAGRQRLKKL